MSPRRALAPKTLKPVEPLLSPLCVAVSALCEGRPLSLPQSLNSSLPPRAAAYAPRPARHC
eukprot:6166527-Pyramimonas_sp.AAC.2